MLTLPFNGKNSLIPVLITFKSLQEPYSKDPLASSHF